MVDFSNDEPKALEQVLADWRGDAQRLRLRGHPHDAQLIEQFAEEVAVATEEYRTFVKEPDARRRSGKSVEWLRGRFVEWERQGHARLDKQGKREYRLLVLPRKANEDAALNAGREAGRQAS